MLTITVIFVCKVSSLEKGHEGGVGVFMSMVKINLQ